MIWQVGLTKYKAVLLFSHYRHHIRRSTVYNDRLCYRVALDRRAQLLGARERQRIFQLPPRRSGRTSRF